MLMHKPQTPQPGFGSITLLQKLTPHFKILDLRLQLQPYINNIFTTFTRPVMFNLLMSVEFFQYYVGNCMTGFYSSSPF